MTTKDLRALASLAKLETIVEDGFVYFLPELDRWEPYKNPLQFEQVLFGAQLNDLILTTTFVPKSRVEVTVHNFSEDVKYEKYFSNEDYKLGTCLLILKAIKEK